MIPIYTEKAECLDCKKTFTRRFGGGNVFPKPIRCSECCDLWQPKPDRLNSGSQTAKNGDCEPELTRKTGIPTRYIETTFQNYVPKTERQAQSLKSARQWVAKLIAGEQLGSLVLSGPFGTGKTHLASSVAQVAYGAGISVRMAKLSKIARDLTESAQVGEGAEEQVIQRYSKFPLLIVDEVRPNVVTDTMRSRMVDIFDNRWDRQIPVVITTNLTLSELPTVLGELVTSRLHDKGLTLCVCDGEDYRKTR